MIADVSGRLKAQHVVEFLAEALQHFKEHRAVSKADPYTRGPYGGKAMKGRQRLGTFQLNFLGGHQGDDLSAELWVDAVSHGYAVADTVRQMAENLAMFRDHDNATGGGVREVLDLLEPPGELLKALKLLFERSIERDREAGIYTPGVTMQDARARRDQAEGGSGSR
jgi:hypothetical protein